LVSFSTVEVKKVGLRLFFGDEKAFYYHGQLSAAPGPAQFFFSELKIQISAGQFWQHS
jgi:hypothetical protein